MILSERYAEKSRERTRERERQGRCRVRGKEKRKKGCRAYRREGIVCSGFQA